MSSPEVALPSTSNVLPCTTVELIGVALNAACTNLNPEGTRRHIHANLRAGATREEILRSIGDEGPRGPCRRIDAKRLENIRYCYCRLHSAGENLTQPRIIVAISSGGERRAVPISSGA